MNVTTPSLTLPAYPQGYEISTARLQLRPPDTSDVEALWLLMSDKRLTTFLAWEPHLHIDDTSRLIESLMASSQADQGFHWVILESGQIAGLVSLIDVRRKHRSWTLNRAELAYWTGVPHHGKGYAAEAAAAVVGFGFNRLHLHKIRVLHAADNPASGRTIEKLGFRFVGEEKDAFMKDGVWHHLRHFELLASEWLRATLDADASRKNPANKHCSQDNLLFPRKEI